MATSRLLLLLPLLLALTAARQVSYSGHQLWRLHDLSSPQSAEKARAVAETLELDQWGAGVDWLDVLVPPRLVQALRRHLHRAALPYSVLLTDVQSLLEQERAALSRRSLSGQGKINTTSYNSLDQIVAYQQELAASNSFVSVQSIGNTVEGRDLLVSTISTGAGKPSVWIDCGIHAREWISPATCVYGLDFLTSNYGVDSDVTQLLDNYDLFILPVHNPDGYEYTWLSDRMWRKNRNKYPVDSCTGIDLNRNYGENWGGIGSSANSCIDTYHGPAAFSELETQAVRDFTLGLQATNSLTFHFSLHSYGQLWMYPWGWSPDDTADAAEQYRVADTGVTALKLVHGTDFTFGDHYHVIYPASGISIDWSYSTGVVYSYILELRDTGEYGFLLPATQITPTCEETWAGLVAAILAA